MNTILFTGLLLIIIIFFLINKMLKEPFQNKCNSFFKDKSFCTYSHDEKKCKCTYQKDGILIPFNSPEDCCKEKCLKKTKENCNDSIKEKEGNFYCNIGGQCKEYQGTIINSHISANNCGTDPLNNQLLLPFSDKESCESLMSPCDNYNNPKLSNDEKKKGCLTNTNCGFCTNEFGKGKCIEGTAEGPLDIIKYNKCVPLITNSTKYTYEYGDFLFN